MTRLPAPRHLLGALSAAAVMALLPAGPAAALVVEGDGASSARASGAEAAAGVVGGVVEGSGPAVLCELVSGLRICSHGDDTHLAAQQTPSGSSSATTSTRLGCYGDGRDGPRVQAVYARPATATDRFPSLLSSFRSWAGAVDAAVDSSARKTKGSRHVRFATDTGGTSCQLQVLRVALPAKAFDSFSATISALDERGLHLPGVKYLVWSDAQGYCGIATSFEDDRPVKDNANNGAQASYARVDRSCWGKVETHEVMHMLGAVQRGAPHATEGMHCRDGSDVMCYADGTRGSTQTSVCDRSHAGLLDCRSDDYFSTAPAAGSWLARHWNTASSAFLAPTWTDPPRPTPQPTPTRSPAPAPTPSPSTGGGLVPLPALPTLLPARLASLGLS